MRGRVVAAVVALAVGVGSAAALDVGGVVDVGLPGPRSSLPAPTATSVPSASPAPTSPPPVLEPVGPVAELPSSDGIRAALKGLLNDDALGVDPGGVVMAAGSGQLLWQRDGSAPRTPASVAKLVTGATVLAAGSPQARVATRVVRGATPGDVLLVGGGDPLLSTRATDRKAYPPPTRLAELADATAEVLRAEGMTSIRLRVDDSAFSGPSVSPDWEDNYVPEGIVAPVHALSVDQGRARPDVDVDQGRARPDVDAQVDDPPVDAGRHFAAMLRARGMLTVGPVRRGSAASTTLAVPTPRAAPEEPSRDPSTAGDPTADPPNPPYSWAAGDEVARVESQPLGVLVEHMLRTSDNDVAEALARLGAAAAGHPASFAGAGAAAVEVLGALGADTAGVRMLDGSGLARGSTLPPTAVATVLAAAASTERPELRFLLTGMPVAGFTGTLADRFSTRRTQAGAGDVRAKTGTLTGVVALAGTVYDAAGRLLTFAVLADDVPPGQSLDARAIQDRVAAVLATCGCA